VPLLTRLRQRARASPRLAPDERLGRQDSTLGLHRGRLGRRTVACRPTSAPRPRPGARRRRL
jgi:hypothetical protein